MRALSLNGTLLAEVSYSEIPIYVKIYKKHDKDNEYECYTWLADEWERISGDSDNIELVYIRLSNDQEPEIIRGELPDGLDLGEFTEQDKLDYFKEKKKQEIASDRYNDEIKGIEVEGIRIDTERDSQALITGAALAAMRDDTYTLKWKAKDGFIFLSAEQVINIAELVRAHVQSCFDREAECIDLIKNCDSLESLNNITYTK